MYRSFFEYPITKPYPYKWFTPAAILGVVVALVVFSLINLASTGYTEQITYTSDPNTTSSQSWLKNWPAVGVKKAQASCQASVAPIGSLLLTNNSALTYEISEVSKKQDGQSTVISMPSLIYNNNPLEHCELLSITMLLEWATGDRTAAQIAWSSWGVEMQGRVACSVANGDGDGYTNLTLTAYYNLVPKTVSIRTGDFKMIGRNSSSQASLWWGESMLASYWYRVTVALYKSNYQNFIAKDLDAYTSGYLYLVRNKNVSDITDLSYFNLLARWITLQAHNADFSTYGNDTDTAANLSRLRILPNIWIEADTMAKAFYSVVMTDLGQTTFKDNILTDPNLLAHFTANLSTTVTPANQTWGPERVQFNAKNSTIGPLGVKPSTLTMDYLCQVPVLKDTGNLLVSLIVADLVFVQALWYLFRHITIFVVKRKTPSMNYCEACAQRALAEGDDTSQLPLKTISRSSAYESLRDEDTAYSASTAETGLEPQKPSNFRLNFRDNGWQRLSP